MKNPWRIFHHCGAQRGGMLVELMLSVALAAIIIPFVFGYQQSMVVRAQNVALTRQIDTVQVALERYIMANREQFLAPVGRNIFRVSLGDLVEFGMPVDIVDNHGPDYQLRVLKSADRGGRATLQGVVVFVGRDISPVRTREIINLGGDKMGFVENNRAYGAFGTWRADAIDFGISGADAIVDTTGPIGAGEKYLWRVASDNAADGTMMSSLNLGGHDVRNAAFVDADAAGFQEILQVQAAAIGNLMFQNRTTIDHQFSADNAVVSGTMSSDGRMMEVNGILSLNDTGKFSSMAVDDLWVTNLTLPGLSVQTDGEPAVLKINQDLDMTDGRIDALFASVSFAGSITPRLVIKTRVEDSINPDFYWDVVARSARLMDMSLMDLNQMAVKCVSREGGGTIAAQIFGAAATNQNATAADFMNAVGEIATRVRAKYRLLNLE